MKKKQLRSFRLHPEDLKELRLLSLALRINQTAVLERALHQLFVEIRKKTF